MFDQQMLFNLLNSMSNNSNTTNNANNNNYSPNNMLNNLFNGGNQGILGLLMQMMNNKPAPQSSKGKNTYVNHQSIKNQNVNEEIYQLIKNSDTFY